MAIETRSIYGEKVGVLETHSAPGTRIDFQGWTSPEAASYVDSALLAPVAQLDRVLASEARGRAFESRRVRQLHPITYRFSQPPNQNTASLVFSAEGNATAVSLQRATYPALGHIP